ncbi:MAG: HAD family phosphatase [Planctomycetota bacterium]
MQKAVIFDVDGVLVDSYQPHFQGWRQMLSELGEDFTEQTFRETFGRTNRDIFADLFTGKYSDAQVQQAADRKEALYREIISADFPAIDGAVELIDALDGTGFLLAVGSSGPPANVQLTLQCLGRAEVMAACVTGADVTRGKPDPQVFQLAARQLGVDPRSCLVVEDAPPGVAAAKAAGMSCIALTGTASREELSDADWVVVSLREVGVQRVSALIEGGQ